MSRGGRGGGRGGRGGGRGGRPNVPWDTGDEPDARPSELFPVCYFLVLYLCTPYWSARPQSLRYDTSLTQQTAIPRPNPPRTSLAREIRRTTSPTSKAPDPLLSSIYIQAYSPPRSDSASEALWPSTEECCLWY